MIYSTLILLVGGVFLTIGDVVFKYWTGHEKPLLYVVGTSDKMYRRGEEFIFTSIPANSKNRYLAVNADHYGTAIAARDAIAAWLEEI